MAYHEGVLWLLPAAVACTLDLASGERAAFYAAIAQDAPTEPSAQDLIFEGWRLGLLAQEPAADALKALLPARIQSEADARHVFLEAVVRDEWGPSQVRGRLKGWEVYDYALYEYGRRKGGCGGYPAFKAISLPESSPLAPYERQGEAISGWAWGEATWDVALEGWSIAEQQGAEQLAAELDGLAVAILVRVELPDAVPAFLERRCGVDLACQEQRRQAIRDDIQWERGPWADF